MLTKMFLISLSVVSLVLSAPVAAHVTEPGAALPHIFTGEHLLTLVIVAVCIVGISKYRNRSR